MKGKCPKCGNATFKVGHPPFMYWDCCTKRDCEYNMDKPIPNPPKPGEKK